MWLKYNESVNGNGGNKFSAEDYKIKMKQNKSQFDEREH